MGEGGVILLFPVRGKNTSPSPSSSSPIPSPPDGGGGGGTLGAESQKRALRFFIQAAGKARERR